MSNPQNATEIGEMTLRFSEASRTLAGAKQEAARIGKELEKLGAALGREPERIQVDGETIYVRTRRPDDGVHQQDVPKMKAADFDLAKIREITETIQKALATVQELGPRMKQLGIGPAK